MKEQLRKFGTLILILALCLTSIGTTKVQAASKPSRPSVSLVKRSKTQAKIKIKKRGKATGYHIAVKTSEAPSDAPAPSATPSEAPSDAPAPSATAVQ